MQNKLNTRYISSAYSRGGQHVDRDRPVDRWVSVGRSHLTLRWIDKILKMNIFHSILQKVHKNEKRCILWHFLLVAILPTGRSRVIKKFSSRSQSKTSWPLLTYRNATMWQSFSTAIVLFWQKAAFHYIELHWDTPTEFYMQMPLQMFVSLK